jgi:hypothetical protein
MRVILLWVLADLPRHHTSARFPYLQDALAYRAESTE